MAKGVKTGGRQKGTPNKLTAATRERIEQEADPVGFLCKVVRGESMAGEAPTLDQRIGAAQTLARKVLPDLSATTLNGSIGVRHEDALKELE